MKSQSYRLSHFVALVLMTASSTKAFSAIPLSTPRIYQAALSGPTKQAVPTALFSTPDPSKSEETDDEIERLKSMAAKLRAEAAALESDQQKAVALAAEKAFSKFDTNKDGEISLKELKDGLEKEFKMELSEKRVQQLMDDFDKSGDGALQLDEFVGTDVMRNRLDALAREEKALANEKAKAAKMEAEAVQLLEAKLAMINDKAPTNSDKLLSCLPYLFPLLDGLQFGRFLVMENLENPVAVVVAIIYALYRAIPFGGMIAFFSLSFLSNNTSINRLIRYNMQQAIYLDIALFFPGLIAALISVISPASIPKALSELGSDLLFFSMLAAVGYSCVSSLLGQEPNKLPVISQAVESRMPTVEMFNSEGPFIPRDDREKDDKKNGE
uniref:EF-hand domain-containing protein n=1 Tax=Entomoneis paludosa TaxID=265537 RepID=A0A7S3DN04_9STRA|mmetsp:Transcript_2194/g.4619  ORF Transcript_2194/g.4619 Transcript_2194/m.4619 type:complete len:384 (+) Transcript_2194:138-1289(+)